MSEDFPQWFCSTLSFKASLCACTSERVSLLCLSPHSIAFLLLVPQYLVAWCAVGSRCVLLVLRLSFALKNSCDLSPPLSGKRLCPKWLTDFLPKGKMISSSSSLSFPYIFLLQWACALGMTEPTLTYLLKFPPPLGDKSSCGIMLQSKPMCHSYWVHILEPPCCN